MKSGIDIRDIVNTHVFAIMERMGETKPASDGLTERGLGRLPLDVQLDRVAAVCRKWGITELAVFGSILRGDFRPDSDVDVLLTFDSNGGYSFETLPDLLDDLSALFGGRSIDMVEKNLIDNPFRRREILSTYRVLYAA